MSKFPENFRLIGGQIYAGGSPDIDFLNFMKSTLGIRVVVSLDDIVGKQIKPYLEKLKIKQLLVPIDSGSSNISDQIKYLARNIVNILSNNQPIYIHCVHGSDRTGLAIAMYRMLAQGIKFEQALREAQKYQYGQRISPAVQIAWNNFLRSMDRSIPDTKIDTNEANAVEEYKPIADQMSEIGNDISPAQITGFWGIPTNNIYNITPPLEPRKRTRLEILKNIKNQTIPSIGQNEISTGRGAGPVENWNHSTYRRE